ncbi:MAG: peptidase U32 family protein [Desulfohalobiaceae bacterium]
MPDNKPEILAPAGGKNAFLAALDAGADSIYCGLKHFSARMQAENFSLQELSCLSQMARERGCRVYVALNSLIKPNELDQAAELLQCLQSQVQPQGLILQDLALIQLAKQAGLRAEMHLSTLAACSSPKALPLLASRLNLQRVVLPRELSLEEIQLASRFCPEGLELEVFVHGALCYAVSGRCYWSSYLGGKSGLRGRCVQPCRRLYSTDKAQQGRFFSCQDLSLDVLAKTLLQIPAVKAWKIEGRKKGAHYVYHTVKAYRLLRDHPQDSHAKKAALELLQECLGRKGSHYYFLPQSPHPPFGQEQENCSGLFVGQTSRKSKISSSSLRPRKDLLPGDLLRIGVQDKPGHNMFRLTSFQPQGRKLTLPQSWRDIPARTPVFLVDRQELELKQRLQQLGKQLRLFTSQKPDVPAAKAKLPCAYLGKDKPRLMQVLSGLPQGKVQGLMGLWLNHGLFSRLQPRIMSRVSLWLPPVIWPQEEEDWGQLIQRTIQAGAKSFVLNSPWQRALFPEQESLRLWAGPFCNLANPLALETVEQMGFSGAFASPELDRQALLELPQNSPLPLGLVLQGLWPFCISRTLHPDLKPGHRLQSPKGEISWIKKSGSNFYHYPNWELDLSPFRQELEQAGYVLLAQLKGNRPQKMPWKDKKSRFNWSLELF